MKQILVTGAAGFIGSHVCEVFLASGWKVRGVDSFDTFYDAGIKRCNLETTLMHPNFEILEGDLMDSLICRRAVQDCNAVVHLAARAGVRPSIEDPQAYIDHNISATCKLLNAMKEAGVNKLIYASSSSVYGNEPHHPWHEELCVNSPISPYAFTKKSCELMNYTYHHLYGLDIINLRLFTVYGPRQRPDLAIHKFFKQILQGQPIPVYGDGSSARDYTYVSDIVAGIESAVQYLLQNKSVYEIINLGNNVPVALNELIGQIEQVLNRKVTIERMPWQPGDVNLTCADISKANNLLGYHPKVTLTEGLIHFRDWFYNAHHLSKQQQFLFAADKL